MTLLPVAESLVRRVLKTGIPGAVLYTQHFTLWIGFLGALAATAFGKHLSLATGEMLPEGRLRQGAQVYVAGLSAGICLLLAYASWVLVGAMRLSERLMPGGLPEWWSQLIMPAALGLMAVRFAWRGSDRWVGRIVAFAITGAMVATGLFEDHAGSLVWPGSIAILVGVLLGAPVFVGMAGLAMLLFYGSGTPIASVPTATYQLVESASLPAIPLLTAAGYVLAEGGASRRLLRLARAMIGWAPGAMALMVVVICTAFTTVTGGSGVTILALGGLVMPMLLSEKYPEGFSLGLVTSAGSLGLLFFPSLPVILYAVVAKESPTDLFAAGLLPGALLVALVALYGIVVGVRNKTPRQPFDGRELGRALWAAKWEVTAPVVLYLLFRNGLTTIVETASLFLLVALVTQSAIFRDLHWRKQLPDTLARGAQLVGAVVLLLGVAMGLTNYLVDEEIPKALIEWTQAHIHSPMVFLLVLNAVLLVLGSVLEIYSAVIILAPLLAPMAVAYGIDPLHLGIVFLANLELGFLFPPMGLNLILSSSRFNQPLLRLYKVSLPFLLIMAGGVLLVTYVPWMTTGMVKREAPAQVQPQQAPE
ncbi:MAG: TRAP transporter large permease subunit [Deltaproteobacteria bacterium]|nr:TRAP transporter large permease subunit [Deltaproteobacteria bacterium]